MPEPRTAEEWAQFCHTRTYASQQVEAWKERAILALYGTLPALYQMGGTLWADYG